jgi:hypothetical protein
VPLCIEKRHRLGPDQSTRTCYQYFHL